MNLFINLPQVKPTETESFFNKKSKLILVNLLDFFKGEIPCQLSIPM